MSSEFNASESPAFDGYHRWLGIPKREQPPHHYRLLGISLFEDDPEVIATAAGARLTSLRQQQSGPHAVLCVRLLNEVSQARLCLLNPNKKAAYDARLQVSLQAASETDDGAADEFAAIDLNYDGIRAPRSASRNASSPASVFVMAILGGVTAMLILWLFNFLPGDGGRGGPRPARPSERPVAEAPTKAKTTENAATQDIGTETRDARPPLDTKAPLIASNPPSNPVPQSQKPSVNAPMVANVEGVPAAQPLPNDQPAEVKATAEPTPRKTAPNREVWDDELQSFEAAKRVADKKFVNAFDMVLASIGKNKSWPVETRSRHITTVSSEKTEFETNKKLPLSDLMLPATIDYLSLLLEKSIPARKSFQKALEKTLRNKPETDRIASEKEKWESRLLPGRDAFGPRTNWHGTRTFATGSTTDFHVHVFKIEDNSITGTFWQDTHTAGKSGWDFEGKLEGNVVVLTSTKIKRGRVRHLALHGFVIDRRLVFRSFVNGKPTNGFVSVSMK